MRDFEQVTVKLLGDATDYLRMLAQAQRATQQTLASVVQSTTGIEKVTGKISGMTSSILSQITAMIGAATLLGTAFKSIQLASDLEQLSISFKVLTGSANTSKKIIEDLTRFAAETPFQMPEIAMAAKQMMAFGSTAEEIIPTMKKLGDVSSALQIPLSSITYLYGTLKAQGQAYTRDIMQFAMRGIPIWKELEKQFGKTNAELRQMLEDGKIHFRDVEKAFTTMTSKGGRFANMMLEQSQTLGGLWSTLKDNVQFALRDIGEEFIKVSGMKDWLKTLINVAGGAGKAFKDLNENVKAFLINLTQGAFVLGGLILGFGALRVALGWMKTLFVAPLAAAAGWLFTIKGGITGLQIGFSVAAIAAAKLLGIVTAIGAGLYAFKQILNLFGQSDRQKREMADAMMEPRRAKLFAAEARVGGDIAGAIGGNRLPFEQVKEAELGLMGANLKVRDREAALKRAEEARDRVDNNPIRRAMGPMFVAQVKQANLELKQAQAAVVQWQAALEKVKSPVNPDDVVKFGRSLKEQIIGFGKDAETKEFMRIFGGGHFPKEQAEAAKALKDFRIDKANAQLQEMGKNLVFAMNTLGKTSDEIDILKLKTSGANPVLAKFIEGLVRLKQQAAQRRETKDTAKQLLEESGLEMMQANDMGRFLSGDWGKVTSAQQLKRKFGIEKLRREGVPEKDIQPLIDADKTATETEKYKDAINEGRRLTEQFLTPQAKMANRQSEIEDLFNRGAISLKVYTRAMMDVRKEFTAFEREVSKVDAVKFGSAEARHRLDEFRAGKNVENIKAPRGGPIQKPVVNLEKKDLKKTEDLLELIKNATQQLVQQNLQKANNPIIKLIQGIGLRP